MGQLGYLRRSSTSSPSPSRVTSFAKSLLARMAGHVRGRIVDTAERRTFVQWKAFQFHPQQLVSCHVFKTGALLEEALVYSVRPTSIVHFSTVKVARVAGLMDRPSLRRKEILYWCPLALESVDSIPEHRYSPPVLDCSEEFRQHPRACLRLGSFK